MALTKSDKEDIRLIFRDELSPTKAEVQTIKQTLYGADGNNGLSKAVKEIHPRLDAVEANLSGFKKQVYGVIGALQIMGVAAWEFLKGK